MEVDDHTSKENMTLLRQNMENLRVDDELPMADDADLETTLDNLRKRCTFLQDEIEILLQHTGTLRATAIVGLTKLFRDRLIQEFKAIEKAVASASEDDVSAGLTAWKIGTNNIPFFEAHWAIAKRCQDVVAFNKSFTYGANKLQDSARVEIVARDGMEWIKVMHIPESRVIQQLAKLGWSQDDSDDEDDEDLITDEDEDEGIQILKMAIKLSKAARSYRDPHKLRHPQVRMIFTRLKENRIPLIDKLLRSIRKLPYVEVEIMDLPDVHSPSIIEALPTMIFDPFTGLSHTLNIDCTVLMALVSELSHTSDLQQQEWFNGYVKYQVEEEKSQPVLPTFYYPVMDQHPLVTTREAFDLFMSIVGEIGTEVEKKRARILLQDTSDASVDTMSVEERRRAWGELSSFDLPPGLHIPIMIVSKDETYSDDDWQAAQPFPDKLASKAMEDLSDANKAVFMYGWRTGRTTVSTNVTVTNKIRAAIEACRGEGEADVGGPVVWHLAPSRSLLAKEKTRSDFRRLREAASDVS